MDDHFLTNALANRHVYCAGNKALVHVTRVKKFTYIFYTDIVLNPQKKWKTEETDLNRDLAF